LSGPTEVVHNDLRVRYERGDHEVLRAMERLAGLVTPAREAIEQGGSEQLGALINENFELRRSMCQIPAGQAEIVRRARAAGASAKFAGSGGAIIGTCPSPEVQQKLQQEMAAIGCRLVEVRMKRVQS